MKYVVLFQKEFQKEISFALLLTETFFFSSFSMVMMVQEWDNNDDVIYILKY